MKKRKPQEGEIRVRLPREKEMFGIIEQRLGYNKMYVRCQDNRIRIGRVPGKYSRRLWIREGDLVLIQPWDIQSEKKGDIVYRYTAAQREWMIQRKKLPEEMK